MKYIITILLILILIAGCSNENIQISRYSKIPATALKISPEMDVSPPKSYSNEYNDPVPLSNTINSAGAEDSPFMMYDGNTFYFFFTPDVNVPVEKQIIDGVTGIYVSKKINNQWTEPERIFLQDKGKVAGDGCEFVQNNKMLFCTVREGYTGIHWFSAEYKDGKWKNWKNADFNPDYKIGELHITSDGNELYYHSDRPGGKGGLDIWKLKKINNEWSNPENVAAVNSEGNEGWPFITQDGSELWITKDYGLWRSKKINGEWSNPELMISPLAGEASLDNQGNVYFTHHFYRDNKMLEADIYVAYKK
ncbi:hypothetical protein J4404_02545 [Candidatus Woesearchaeota archaeon]|nr:hypothetical protein [Candidatus Woesearchaeota archaeon]